MSGFDSIFSGFSHIDDDFYEELEEILVMGDIGIRATEEIIENLKQKVKENHIKEPADCRELLSTVSKSRCMWVILHIVLKKKNPLFW